MDTITKSPAEVVEHEFDFSTFGTIDQFAISASQTGLTLVSATLLAGVLTVRIGGGLPDWCFELGARAIRTGGRQKEKRVRVEVVGPALDDLTTGTPVDPEFPSGGILLGPDAILLSAAYLVLMAGEELPSGAVLLDEGGLLLEDGYVLLA